MLRYLLFRNTSYHLLTRPGHNNLRVDHVRKFAQQTNKIKTGKSKKDRNGYRNGVGLAMTALASSGPPNVFGQSPQYNGVDPQYQQGSSFWTQPGLQGHVIDLHTFFHQMLSKGEVQEVIISRQGKIVRVVLHDGAIINGRRVMLTNYILQVPDVNSFEDRLREFENSLGVPASLQVPVRYESPSDISGIVWAAVLIGLGYYMYKQGTVNVGGGIMSSFTRPKFTLVDSISRAADSTSIRFKDVAGLKEAKVEIMEFVDYLKNANKFLQLGAKLPKGVLLTGPPGCGKTLLAKAVATEGNVPFLAMSGSDFVEMIGGVGASRVRKLFKKANKLAPCIIYIDEIDSIGQKRSNQGFSNTEMEQTLNQLLVEMDGMTTRKGVIVLASTNRDDVLDKALLRAGRFDRQILIDLPNLAERKEIFEQHASKIKLAGAPRDFASRIAQLTPGMSGADLANICNEAALHAARTDKRAVTSNDLEYAIERVVGGTEKRSSSISAEEKRIIAYHECGHALVGWLLEHTDPLLKVSIVPRTTNILGFAQYLPSDQKLYSPQQFFDRMCMALGGRVAELVKFNHLSTGAQDDIKRVTQMAMAQITEYGFDPVVGQISFSKEEINKMGKKPYSKRLAGIIDVRAGVMVKDAFERTQKLLSDNMDKLDLLAENLLAKEVMNTSDVEKLIGPRPFKKSQSESHSSL